MGPLPDPGIPEPQPTAQPSWLGASYSYDEDSSTHAVTNVNREQAGGGSSDDTYTYDNNGNMTCRYESSQTWVHSYNPENRLSKVEKVPGTCASPGTLTDTWTFTYDGDGVRVMEVYSGTGSSYTKYYFAGGAYEVMVEGANTTTKRYYSIAGQMVAMHDGTNLKYFAQDHLSSTSIVMNNTGGLLSHNRYMPFGDVRDITGSLDPITQTDFGYTGQRNISSMGLMDYRARFYSPVLGRFTQPDSIISNPGNPQNLNHFSYVLNNPIKNIDPSGHICIEGMDLCTEDDDSDGWWFDTGKHCRINPDDPVCWGSRQKKEKKNEQHDKSGQRHEFCFDGPFMDVCLELMPPGTDKSVHGDHDSAHVWHETGLTLEFAEITAAASQYEPLAMVLGGIDLFATAVGCLEAGDCYYGYPGYGLPPMVVTGQDVIITEYDLIIGSLGALNVAAPGLVDTITSGYSAAYDWGRLYNNYETYVNFGMSPFTPDKFYILIYPP